MPEASVTKPGSFMVVWIGWMHFALACGIVLGLIVGIGIGVLAS